MDIKNQYTGEIILSVDSLRGANLIGLDLRLADLRGANLAGAYLGGAYLSGANLAGANLAGANLAGANLADDYIAGANLADDYIARAVLADTNLAGANLIGVDLRLATGNMREVRSMQVDRWRVVWWMSGDTLMLAIGCKMYPAEQWWDFTDEQIEEMGDHALDWRRKWKTTLRLIVTELAPATPSQRAKNVT